MGKIFITGIFVLLLFSSCWSAELTVHVVDRSNNSIDGTKVQIGRMSAITDANGIAKFFRLGRGKYNLKVSSADNFELKERIHIDAGQNEIQVKTDSYGPEKLYQREQDYDEEYTESEIKHYAPYVSPKRKKRNKRIHQSKIKSINRDIAISLTGMEGYNYVPSSRIKTHRSGAIAYSRSFMKQNDLKRNTDVFSAVYGISEKTEISLIHYSMGDVFTTDSSEKENDTVFSMKRKVFERGNTHDSVGLRIGESRIDLINMTGFNISKTGKEFGFVDLVLESSFFDSKNTFKSGFGLRVFLKDGFNLVIDGRYNFSDEFSNFSAGIEKEFGPCFLNMFYSWSDLVVDVDIYSIGLKWNFK